MAKNDFGVGARKISMDGMKSLDKAINGGGKSTGKKKGKKKGIGFGNFKNTGV